jgi:hypothetical protein
MLGLEGYANLYGVEYPITHLNPWEINDETSPMYFSDAHRQIRSLIRRDHVRPTRTKYHLFHSEADALIPIAHKERLVALLREHGVDVSFNKVTPADLDGRLFKTMAHGMDASLRGIFDLVAASDPHGLAKEDTATDFTLNAEHRFDCGDRCYVFRFTDDYSLAVSLSDR